MDFQISIILCQLLFHHCSADPRLRDSATLRLYDFIDEKFQLLRWAFRTKKIVWFENDRSRLMKKMPSHTSVWACCSKSLRFLFCCLAAQLTSAVFEILHEACYFWPFFRSHLAAFFIFVIFEFIQSRSRLKSAIYANLFIRRLIICRLRCSSARRWFFFSIILKFLVVRLDQFESFCLNRFV